MLYSEDGGPRGLIFNIQRYTIHDGPGIRTEIFFKGCTVNCPWCSNPEGIKPLPELGVYPSKCLGRDRCGWCLKNCPLGGAPIRFGADGIVVSVESQDACLDCAACAGDCPAGAIKLWGEKMSVPQLMSVIEQDRSYYARTGGGVTLSGGEVLAQWEFARELLRACREAGINTCVESALNVPREHMTAVLEYTDLLITDIKFIDSGRHRAVTGVGNDRILDNIRTAALAGVPMVVRTPVVPGYNDDEENILGTGEFLRDNAGEVLLQYQLLPYRKLGTEKYASLGAPYPMGEYEAPQRGVWEPNLLRLRDLVSRRCGIPTAAGSSEKLPGFPQGRGR